jgi:hypothetical protein
LNNTLECREILPEAISHLSSSIPYGRLLSDLCLSGHDRNVPEPQKLKFDEYLKAWGGTRRCRKINMRKQRMMNAALSRVDGESDKEENERIPGTSTII